jgi:hypothetical protein
MMGGWSGRREISIACLDTISKFFKPTFGILLNVKKRGLAVFTRREARNYPRKQAVQYPTRLSKIQDSG